MVVANLANFKMLNAPMVSHGERLVQLILACLSKLCLSCLNFR